MSGSTSSSALVRLWLALAGLQCSYASTLLSIVKRRKYMSHRYDKGFAARAAYSPNIMIKCESYVAQWQWLVPQMTASNTWILPVCHTTM